MAAQLDEAEKQILGALLIDFSERHLDAQQLKKPYEGPKISDLISAICSGDDITRVDFDIALNDLVKQNSSKRVRGNLTRTNQVQGLFLLADIA
ncbi:hypothetical protein [Pseudomonas sp.]|uniref:hypothetical protein n=1 Tax=Pseudomonas sp. TaxID=306 RepID=UPI003BB4F05A